MKRLLGFLSLSAITLAPLSASAEIIDLYQKHKAPLPTIVRGAPQRCDGAGPLIIHVNAAPKAEEACVPKARLARYAAPSFNQTIVVVYLGIDRRHGHRHSEMRAGSFDE